MGLFSMLRRRFAGPLGPVQDVADQVFASLDPASLTGGEATVLRDVLAAGASELSNHGFGQAPFTKLLRTSEQYANLRISPYVLLPGEALVSHLEFRLEPTGGARWTEWKAGDHNDFDFSRQRGFDPFSESWALFHRSLPADRLVNLVHRALCAHGRLANVGAFPDGLLQLQQDWAICILAPSGAKPLRVQCERYSYQWEHLGFELTSSGELSKPMHHFRRAPAL